ncbi:MAG: BTAD domain-containing putative transcriptional regulator [Chloroflexota bacterium]
MEPLKIHLFGRLRLYRGERSLDRFPTVKAQHLFCYLVLRRRQSHSRQALAALLWGDKPESQARHCLRTTLSLLREFLEGNGDTRLIRENDHLGFNTDSDYWLDVEAFEAGLHSAPHGRVYTLPIENPRLSASSASHSLNSEAAGRLAQAVALYEGNLLPDCYEEWCIRERERLQELLLAALTQLVGYYRQQGCYTEALSCGRHILAIDPLLESVHREVMGLYSLAGERPAAVRQYYLCRGLLARELGVEPMAETTALYHQLCQNGEVIGDHPLPAVQTPTLATLGDTRHELRSAQAEFQQLAVRCQRAAEGLEGVLQALSHF